MKTFNPEMLTLARQIRRLSQTALAKKTSISQVKLSRIETAQQLPTDDELKTLSGYLNIPTTFFYQHDQVYGLPLSVHTFFRKTTQATQTDIDQIKGKMHWYIMSLRRMLKSIEVEPQLPFPQLDIEDYDGNVERVARDVRRSWLIPNGPIKNLAHYAEKAGCIIFVTNLGKAPIDGLSIKFPDTPPCIFLREDQPPDRMRLTLAHEIGHLVLHRMPSPFMEKEAYDFGAALLMPKEDIYSHLINIHKDFGKLASLKKHWKVSMQAVAKRAKDLGAISEYNYKSIMIQFSSCHWRMQEPVQLETCPDLPETFKQILSMHLDDLGYSINELAELVSMKSEEMKELFGLMDNEDNKSKPRLRLIK